MKDAFNSESSSSPILIIAGPYDFYDREVISNALVDMICDIAPVKIITGDSRGVDQIVAELCHGLQEIEYERYYANYDKFRKSAKVIRDYQMTLVGTHLLIFYNETMKLNSMLYYAEHENLKIKKIRI
jgi:hypothetical protein